MKALYYIGDCKMELRDIPIPQPDSNEYLVHIDACGICGSDIEGCLGKTGRRVPPMIMGHECAGTVAKTPVNGKYPLGTKVAIFPKFYCGTCDTCKQGLVNLCPNADFLGVMAYDGAMTEYVCVKENYLIPYEGAGAEFASMAEPAAVAYNGVYKLSDEQIKNAEHILVVGAGTIGLLVLSWLKYRKAKHIIVSDATDFRLKLAKKMGADATINPGKENFEEKISALTNGKMCDYAIEAVGISPTAKSSIDALKNAGTAVWIGNAQKMVSIDMQKVVTQELKIFGNYIYSLEDFITCVKLLSEKAIDVSPLITRVMDLSKGVEAFDMLINNKDTG